MCCCCCRGAGGGGGGEAWHGRRWDTWGHVWVLARWHEADMNGRLGALTNRKRAWGGSCSRSLLDGIFGSGVVGWLPAPLLPSPICYTHKILARTRRGLPPSLVPFKFRLVCGAALTRSAAPLLIFYQTAITDYYASNLLSFYPACLQLHRLYIQALFYPAPAAIYGSTTATTACSPAHTHTSPCIFIVHSLSCLSFVPALNFDLPS